MKKAITIIVFFCSLFIGKEAFASDFEAFAVYQNGIVDFSQMQDTYPLTTDPECSFYCTGSYISSADIYKGSYLDKTNYQFGSYSRILWTPSENYADLGELVFNFLLYQNPADGDYWVDISFANREVWNNPVPLTDKAFFTFSVLNGGLVNLNSPLPAISSITPSYPVNTTIQPPENLNQTIKLPVTLTGSYTNIDGYNYILVYGLDEGLLGREYVLCESDIGESGDYSCSVDFWTNKTYNYEMIMTKTPAPSSPSVSSGVKSFSIGEPFISSNDFLTSDNEECEGYTDIYCHLKNAFRWGFIPSKATFYKFVSLSNKIMERAPFGYAKIIYQKLENLQIDETNNLELVSLEAIDEMIYSPFRVAFSYILYFIFVVGLYFRFRNINI